MLLPTNGSLPDLIERRTERSQSAGTPSSSWLSSTGLGSRTTPPPGPNSFEKTMEPTAGSGCSLGIELRAVDQYRLLRGERDRMDEIIEFVRGLDHVRTHTISMVRGDLADETYLRADPRKYERAVDQLAENMRRGRSPRYRFRGGRVKAAQDLLQRRLIHRTAVEKRRVVPRYAGRLNVVLTETGDAVRARSDRAWERETTAKCEVSFAQKGR
jgi:hypothetical protein